MLGKLDRILKKGFVRECIVDKRLEFIGLQETIKSDFSPNELHNLSTGKNFLWEWIAPRGKSGGILVGVNNDSFDIVHVEKGEYFVRLLLFDKNTKFHWNLITVYGDA